MPEKHDINGLDANRLDGAIKSMREAPQSGKFKLRAHNRWIDGAHAFSEIKDFEHAGEEYIGRPKPFIADADEPEILLGADYGPNATEWLLHALACCLNTTLIYHATIQRIPVQKLEFDMEGDIDVRGVLGISDEVRRGFQNIRVTCKIEADAPQEKLEELVETAQKYSPVFDMVTNKVPVTVNMETEETRKAA